MKKTLFLSILLILTTSLYGQNQWYNRQYGVNNINELSEAQLKMALQNAETKIKTGRILTFVGIGTTLLGGILYADGMSSAGDTWDEFWQNVGQAGGGIFLMIAGSGTIAFGVPFWIVGANRKSAIEVGLQVR